MNHYHQNGKIFAPAPGDPNGYGGCIQVDREDVPAWERDECDDCIAALSGETQFQEAA